MPLPLAPDRVCRHRGAVPTPERYEVVLEHDGRSYPVVVEDLPVDVCPACGNRVLGDAADDLLSRALRAAAGLLQPEEVRAGRERLGLTPAELADHLRVAPATLSRWESGGQIQQRGVDTLLRLYFKLPEVRAELAAPPASSAGRSAPAPAAAFAAPAPNGFAPADG